MDPGKKMTNPKVAVLVADTFGDPFESIKRDIQPRVWDFSQTIDVYYMMGVRPTKVESLLNNFTNSARYSKLWRLQRLFDRYQLALIARRGRNVVKKGNELRVDIPEGLRYLGLKVIESIKFLHEQNYDIIYKTTLSSLVNPKVFSGTIEKVQLDSPFYGGTPMNFGTHPFVSGANLMINRRTSEIILSSLDNWDHGLLDDVAIGRLLERRVAITPVRSINLTLLDDIYNYTDPELNEVMHFRCKSSNKYRNDVAIMSQALKRIQDAE